MSCHVKSVYFVTVAVSLLEPTLSKVSWFTRLLVRDLLSLMQALL